MFGVPKFNDPKLKFSFFLCIVEKLISTKGNLKKYIILCPLHECKQHSYCVQFLNNEDGSKINLLMNSHHYKVFPNGQLNFFLKLVFLFFTT